MIDLSMFREKATENFDLLQIVTVISLISALAVAELILFLMRKRQRRKPDFVDHLSVFLGTTFVVLVICALVTPFRAEYNGMTQKEYVLENVQAKYGMTIENDDALDPSKFKENIPSDKFYGKLPNDSRIYEVYFVLDNSGNLSLYTKNEKGVYLPLTTMVHTGSGTAMNQASDIEDEAPDDSSIQSVGEVIEF